MFSARRMTPVTPIATGTPTPSTTACTASRSPIGTTWNAALIDVRVVPSVAAMSAMRSTPASTKSPNEAALPPAAMTAITASTTATTAGLKTSPRRRPNRRISGPARSARKRMSTRLSTAV